MNRSVGCLDWGGMSRVGAVDLRAQLVNAVLNWQVGCGNQIAGRIKVVYDSSRRAYSPSKRDYPTSLARAGGGRRQRLHEPDQAIPPWQNEGCVQLADSTVALWADG